MKIAIILLTIFLVASPSQAFESPNNSHIFSKEFGVCIENIPGARVEIRDVIDVVLADVRIGNNHATIAIDPLGIGTYTKIISELGVKGHKRRDDGVVVFSQIYDEKKTIVIARKEQEKTGVDAWVYITVDETTDSASQILVDKIINALHWCS